MNYTAGILLETSDGKLILQHRDNIPNIINPGMVSTFGGHAEPGEVPIDTAIREIEEETNLKLFASKLKIISIFMMSGVDHSDEYTFLAQDIDPKLITVNEGQGMVIISKEDDLSKINLAPFARYLIYLYWKK